MKSVLPLFILIVATSLLFLSCQKEVNSDNVIAPVPSAGSDSNYLSKIYLTVNDGSGLVDTFEIFTYEFDNLKRVARLVDSSDDNTFQSLLPLTVTQYYYQGNDSLPYKLVKFADPSANYDYDTLTSFFSYNANGMVVSDSVVSVDNSGGVTVFTDTERGSYQYSGNTITGVIYKTFIDQNGNSSNAIETDTAQTDARGNIISNVKHEDPNRTVYSTFTWDNNPSPFARLSNFRTFEIFPFGETLLDELPSNNNRLHAIEQSSGTTSLFFEEDLTGKYTYKSNGYPLYIIDPDLSSPGTVYKTIFEYKAL